jgi:hypothetical protein
MARAVEACVEYLGFGKRAPKRVTEETVQAVLADGTVIVQDTPLRTTGNVHGLQAGDRVTVAWDRPPNSSVRAPARPVAIYKHTSKRAQSAPAIRRLAEGIVEELFLGPNPTFPSPFADTDERFRYGYTDVWYRDSEVVLGLGLVPDLHDLDDPFNDPPPDLIGWGVRWGDDGKAFVVSVPRRAVSGPMAGEISRWFFVYAFDQDAKKATLLDTIKVREKQIPTVFSIATGFNDFAFRAITVSAAGVSYQDLSYHEDVSVSHQFVLGAGDNLEDIWDFMLDSRRHVLISVGGPFMPKSVGITVRPGEHLEARGTVFATNAPATGSDTVTIRDSTRFQIGATDADGHPVENLPHITVDGGGGFSLVAVDRAYTFGSQGLPYDPYNVFGQHYPFDRTADVFLGRTSLVVDVTDGSIVWSDGPRGTFTQRDVNWPNLTGGASPTTTFFPVAMIDPEFGTVVERNPIGAFLPDFGFYQNWVSTFNYPLYATVDWSNQGYQSLIADNLGNDPRTSPSAWQKIQPPQSGHKALVMLPVTAAQVSMLASHGHPITTLDTFTDLDPPAGHGTGYVESLYLFAALDAGRYRLYMYGERTVDDLFVDPGFPDFPTSEATLPLIVLPVRQHVGATPPISPIPPEAGADGQAPTQGESGPFFIPAPSGTLPRLFTWRRRVSRPPGSQDLPVVWVGIVDTAGARLFTIKDWESFPDRDTSFLTRFYVLSATATHILWASQTGWQLDSVPGQAQQGTATFYLTTLNETAKTSETRIVGIDYAVPEWFKFELAWLDARAVIEGDALYAGGPLREYFVDPVAFDVAGFDFPPGTDVAQSVESLPKPIQSPDFEPESGRMAALPEHVKPILNPRTTVDTSAQCAVRAFVMKPPS